eukprot:2041677-Prorocentrum_lima.AAC.1
MSKNGATRGNRFTRAYCPWMAYSADAIPPTCTQKEVDLCRKYATREFARFPRGTIGNVMWDTWTRYQRTG